MSRTLSRGGGCGEMNVLKESPLRGPRKHRRHVHGGPGDWRKGTSEGRLSERRLLRRGLEGSREGGRRGGTEPGRWRPPLHPDPREPHPHALCTPGQALAGSPLHPGPPKPQPQPLGQAPLPAGAAGVARGLTCPLPARSAVALGPFAGQGGAGRRGSSPRATGYQSLNRRDFCKYRPGRRKGRWSAGPRSPPTGGGGQEAPSGQMLKTDENE